MAIPETIHMGGLQLRFLRSNDSTGGSLDMFEMTVQPKARMPAPIRTPAGTRRGRGLPARSPSRLAAAIDVIPRSVIFIPRNVVHGFDNLSEGPPSSFACSPPGGLGPGYFREVAGLLAQSPPDRAKIGEVMRRYGLPAP